MASALKRRFETERGCPSRSTFDVKTAGYGSDTINALLPLRLGQPRSVSKH